MKITIITCTYNSENTIADCVSSINNQNYPHIEHIIIDGASKDNTVKIVGSLPGRETRIISEPDDGLYHAMNKGIKLASGGVSTFKN